MFGINTNYVPQKSPVEYRKSLQRNTAKVSNEIPQKFPVGKLRIAFHQRKKPE